MSNFRVFYPLESVAMGGLGSASGTSVHGLQSVSTTTSFNLEQVFELGQLDIYEYIETLPSVEMTMEKVLDGYPLIYHLGSVGCSTSTLLNRSNRRADIFLSIFSDTIESSSGVPVVQAYCSGMYLSSLNYKLPIASNFTESVTYIGNDKIWISSASGTWYGRTGYAFNGDFTGDDTPASGVQRRQMVVMGTSGSIFPANLPGINASGYNIDTGVFSAHLQDINISANLGRTDLLELGRRRPYYKYANFPIEVDCTIAMAAGGDNPGDMINANSDTDNVGSSIIKVVIQDGTVFDLGNDNKLSNIAYSGGDTGGGVVTITYSYKNYNHLDVTSPSDPEGMT